MQTYSSKFDQYIAVASTITILVLIAIDSSKLQYSSIHSILVLLSISNISIAITFICMISCNYALAENFLIIRPEFIHKQIRYSNISKVNKFFNPSAAPALSLNRIKITHKNGSIIISPENSGDFIQYLEKNALISEVNLTRQHVFSNKNYLT